MRRTLICITILTMVSCGLPDDSDIRREFLSEYPKASIIALGVGEGDSRNAYYHIRYRLHDEPSIYEVVWLYQKQANGSWIRVHKSEEKVVATP